MPFNNLKSQFANKKYIITGASSGIGYDVMNALLDEGAIVVGIGRDRTKIADLLVKYPPEKLSFISFELKDIENIETKFEDEIIPFSKFDGLILCAGVEETLPLGLYKVDRIIDLFKINVFSSVEILRIFSRKKVSNDGASVVFISSVMGELGQAGKVGYCGSKSAILGIVKASALELLKRNIRVNAISPAIVKTAMSDKLLSVLSRENIEEIEKMHPKGFGETSDVVPMIMFLLSDWSKWITGQNIKIDGGYSIR